MGVSEVMAHLPTHSLYKLMVFAGLAGIIYSQVTLKPKLDKMQNEISEAYISSYDLAKTKEEFFASAGAEVQLGQELLGRMKELDDQKASGKLTPEEWKARALLVLGPATQRAAGTDELSRIYEENRRLSKETEENIHKYELAKSDALIWEQIVTPIFWYSLACASLGAFLWYWNEQRWKDRMLRQKSNAAAKSKIILPEK